jgi:hypothetical protein
LLLHTSLIMRLLASTDCQYFSSLPTSVSTSMPVGYLTCKQSACLTYSHFPVANFCVEDGGIHGETFSEMLIDWQRAKRLALNVSTYLWPILVN